MPLPAMSRDDVVRFWSKVRRESGSDGCWLWVGSTRRGYGRIRIGSSIYSAHRVAWELVNGPLPVEHVLDHGESCSNRACVRPSHLEVVTHGENVRRANLKREPKPGRATGTRSRRGPR